MACLCQNNINIKIQRVHILQNPNTYQHLIVISFPLNLFHDYGLNFPINILGRCNHIFQVWLLMDYYITSIRKATYFASDFVLPKGLLVLSFFVHLL